MEKHIYIRIGLIGVDTVATVVKHNYDSNSRYLNENYECDPNDNSYIDGLVNNVKRKFPSFSLINGMTVILQDYEGGKAKDIFGVGLLMKQHSKYTISKIQLIEYVFIDSYVPYTSEEDINSWCTLKSDKTKYLSEIKEYIENFIKEKECPYFFNDNDPVPVSISYKELTRSPSQLENVCIEEKRMVVMLLV